ncbi:surf-like protein [Allomyces javanicus]|nr:surf-like protein [Allomyces javanicus]
MTILYVFPAAAFGLGSWQLYRLRWKLGLIQETEAALARPPVPLDASGTIGTTALPDTFTKVSVDATLDPTTEFLVGPRVRDGENGFHIVAPYTTTTGTRLLVNRGWIANGKASSTTARFSEPGPRRIVGLAKLPGEKPSSWTPDNEPSKNQWYWIDVADMSKRAQTQALVVEEVDEGRRDTAAERDMRDAGLPLPKEPTANLRNNHLEYAVTWFSLSAATLAMIVFRKKIVGGSVTGAAALRGSRGRLH